MDYEKEQKRLKALWADTLSDEEIINSESEAEEDNVSVNSDYSDYEQEADDSHMAPDTIGDSEEAGDSFPVNEDVCTNQTSKYYRGKDSTKWKKDLPAQNVRTRAQNIIVKLPFVREYAKNAKSLQECFLLFIDEGIISDIAIYTNQKISGVAEQWKDSAHYTETSVDEIKAVFGLLFLAGVFKSNRRTLKEVWSDDGTGIDIFQSTMGQRRFEFLLVCLRFDNRDNRDERRETDKLAGIRAVVKFNENCQNAYRPSAYLTIDEKPESFRGRCSFRQYMPNKPAKYGIKVHALVDARSYFLLNMEVYVGKQPEGPFMLTNSAKDIVDRLVAPISGSNRNVTFDNWYISYELLEHLRKRHKLTAIGTIRKNKRQIPNEFLNVKNREIGSSLFGFQEDCTLLSYKPKQGKVVLLVSTLHHNGNIENNGNKDLPEMIGFYNFTKGGVDTVDELSSNYNTARNSRRWPLTLFFSLLNRAGINSQIIYRENNNGEFMQRRCFLKNLGLQLVDAHQKRRMSNPRLTRELRGHIRAIRGEDTEPPKKKVRPNQVGRCQVCPRKKDRKTKYVCESCDVFLCLEHANFYCANCLEKDTE